MRTRLNICSFLTIIICAGAMLLFKCDSSNSLAAQIGGDNIMVEFNPEMHSRISSVFNGKPMALGSFSSSEFVRADSQMFTDFPIEDQRSEAVKDAIGEGQRLILTGKSGSIEKMLRVTVYKNFPAMAVFKVAYKNIGSVPLKIERWVSNHYRLELPSPSGAPVFWSFHGGSYSSRPDWILPVSKGFDQQNYMGMNDTDYGGGIPVSDIWSPHAGIAVGHLETTPKLVSLPVTMTSDLGADLAVSQDPATTLKTGEVLETLTTFVSVHQGDYFSTLRSYRNYMEKSGVRAAVYPESSYEPVWCAWGFERDFTMQQIYGALPKARELGFKWAVLDDGWQTAEGDWYLNKSKFPRGDRDMLAFTQAIRKAGMRPKIWWAPLAVDPGTDLIKNHPDYLLVNKEGKYQDISWWDAFYLCPAYPPVQEYTRNLVKTIMSTWGYDGLKIDGQHLNGAPPCYNKAHNHAYPEESFEKMPEFFKAIYETALSIKSDAVVEICPCGATYAFHTTPFMNQPVSSDPESSLQIRIKGKTLKALMGLSMPYYGDHVELSDGQNDFASTVGIGGVVGTKFTWPVGAKKDSKIDLTPEKEVVWKKWTSIYLDKMLSKGIYRGELYDLGFDRPETHAVEKDGRMYYAFYADSFDGPVELRGLGAKSYQIHDYVNDKAYGTISGPAATLPVSFTGHLLLEAIPE